MDAAEANRAAWADLSLRALPSTALFALLRAFGGPEAILGATRAQLAAVVPDSVAEQFPPSATMCNKCNTKATIIMDGCATCLNCGYSKCG